jgi:hypothetical protein
VRLLLLAYPRRWRERYADELLALLEAEPLTWRVRANVAAAGLRERLRSPGPPQLTVLWGWSLFVVGGMAFQKTSEHWQVAVPAGVRTVPTIAFDVVQAAAAIGSAAVLVGVGLALPAFVRDVRGGGWPAVRRPILVAAAATVFAAGALVAVAVAHDVVAASAFVAFAACSLFAWTRAAVLAARRLEQPRAPVGLALTVAASMVVMVTGAAVWFAAVTAHAPSFVGVAQLAVVATFMLAGAALGSAGAVRAFRA